MPKIEDGSKTQTMRNERARHARPGEEMQNYYAMRTKQCRLINKPTCLAVTPVRIDFQFHRIHIAGRAVIKGAPLLINFAICDGFEDWDDLRDFWDENHPEVDRLWSGVLIEWKNLTKGD